MMTIEQEKAFQAERMSGLGGSDAAAVVGLNKWMSPLRLWRIKKGLETVEPNEPMYWGVVDEPAIRNRYREMLADRSGGKQIVVEHPEIIRHREAGFLIAHIDGLIKYADNGKPGEEIGIFEAKSVGPHMAKEFGDEWTDEVPQSYLIQCQHYMGVTGLDFAHMAVRFGNSGFKIFEIKANDDLIGPLFDQEADFWEKYILTDTPPPIDGSDSAKEMLATMFPADTGEIVETNEEVDKWAEQLRTSTTSMAEAKELLQEAQNHIKDHMKDASILVGSDFKITWKKSKDSHGVDYKNVVSQLLASVEDPALKQAVDRLIKANTTTKQGSRRFLPKFD